MTTSSRSSLSAYDDDYRVLGITEAMADDKKTIDDSYRKLALVYHPDRQGDKSDQTKMFARITVARERLLKKLGDQNSASNSSSRSSSRSGFRDRYNDRREWRDATKYSSASYNGSGSTSYSDSFTNSSSRRNPSHVGRQYGGTVLSLWIFSLVTFGGVVWGIGVTNTTRSSSSSSDSNSRRREAFERRERAREIGKAERTTTTRLKKNSEKVIPREMILHHVLMNDGGNGNDENENNNDDTFDRRGYYETANKKFRRVKPFISKYAEQQRLNRTNPLLTEKDIESALAKEREIECCAKCGWPLPYLSTMSCVACGSRTTQKRDVVRVVINKKPKAKNDADIVVIQ
jgi:curved DNA-binding protein CbpA